MVLEHLKAMYEKAATNLSPAQSQALGEVRINQQDAFMGANGKLGVAKPVKHSIDTTNNLPIKTTPKEATISHERCSPGTS